jgi:valyl-tRNA synthetase
VMPFLTDELWTALTGGESVMVARWPAAIAGGPAGPDLAAGPDPGPDLAAEAEIGSLMRLVTSVRRFRADQGLRPGQRVPAVLEGIGGTPLARHEPAIRALLRLGEPGTDFSPNASVPAEGITVRLDTSAGIDLAAERRRMEKDLATARADALTAEGKLASPSFTDRAPAAVVAKNRDRLAAAQSEIRRLEARLGETS